MDSLISRRAREQRDIIWVSENCLIEWQNLPRRTVGGARRHRRNWHTMAMLVQVRKRDFLSTKVLLCRLAPRPISALLDFRLGHTALRCDLGRTLERNNLSIRNTRFSTHVVTVVWNPGQDECERNAKTEEEIRASLKRPESRRYRLAPTRVVLTFSVSQRMFSTGLTRRLLPLGSRVTQAGGSPSLHARIGEMIRTTGTNPRLGLNQISCGVTQPAGAHSSAGFRPQCSLFLSSTRAPKKPSTDYERVRGGMARFFRGGTTSTLFSRPSPSSGVQSPDSAPRALGGVPTVLTLYTETAVLP